MAGRLPEIPNWSAPQALRHLLERDELIKPADNEFPADFGRLGLHLDDLKQNVEVDMGRQVIVPEPVEPGLGWWGGKSHRSTSDVTPGILRHLDVLIELGNSPVTHLMRPPCLCFSYEQPATTGNSSITTGWNSPLLNGRLNCNVEIRCLRRRRQGVAQFDTIGDPDDRM